MGGLESLAEVVEPSTKVLVIHDTKDPDFYRQVVRGMGVSECVFKPLSRDMLARYFVPIINSKAAGLTHDRGGRLLAVVGARGGVGASVLAVNLAWHLGVTGHHHTALVDADLYRASSALMLGTQTNPGLKEALERPERVDNLFVERVGQVVADRLHLFASEENLDTAVETAPEAAARLVDVLRERYNFIVVDLPTVTESYHRDLFRLAHHRIIVMEPSLLSLRDTLRLLALPAGVNQIHRPTVVLNRATRPGALSRSQLEDGTGLKIDHVIPDLGASFSRSSDFGKLQVERARPFRQVIVTLARDSGMVERTDSSAGAAPSSRKLRHFFSRK